MELRHLRYFTAVAETCHFGRAAERLHLAQAAVSQAIRQLESELGAALFTRTTRHVALTPAGEFLLGEARRILEAVEASAVGVRRVSSGHRGLLRVGLTPTAVLTQLSFIARTIEQKLPDVALEVHADLLTPQLCAGLRAGDLDIAVLRPPVEGADIDVRTIEAEPLVVALPDGHPLCSRPRLSVADLRSESFVMFSAPNSAVNDAVSRACHAAGFTPHREHVAPSTAALLALVGAGLGVALVPGSARSLPLDGVQFVEPTDGSTVEIALASACPNSALVDAVVDALDIAGLFSGSTTQAEAV